MLTRFCLYGFLKNQRYFEPFFMLALLAHEISFTEIGFLVACRSLTLNVLEVPSGGLADTWGRRRCMIASFIAYVISFFVFAWASSPLWLYPAMILYGIGDSFRTGTHKAMIFEWLRLQGREGERTKVYGITRSWSKYGSALSSVLSAVCVLSTGDFRSVFLFATIPYILNIINFLGYPPELDGSRAKSLSFLQAWRDFRSALLTAWRKKSIRRLIAESMCWEGVYNAIHDYLQPALLLMILGLLTVGADPELTTISPQSAASSPLAVIVISSTYAILALLSGSASRFAHRLVAIAGSETRAACMLWSINTLIFVGLGLFDIISANFAVVLMFVLLGVLQNVWRPILISRFDDQGTAKWGATLLSIESQSQRIATLLVAPAIGLAIDLVARHGGYGHFWPIAVVGFMAALPMLVTARQSSAQAHPSAP